MAARRNNKAQEENVEFSEKRAKKHGFREGELEAFENAGQKVPSLKKKKK